MGKRVHSYGSLSSKILLVAEAPGEHEEKAGQPLVGPAGKVLNELWRGVGLKRSDFRLSNVFEYRAPSSKIAKAHRDEVEAWAATVHTRVTEPMEDPWLICPMGDYALRALMRKPLWSQQSPKIWDWRGSIMQYTFDDGRTCKMIPTPHPAAVFYDPSIIKLCRADWKRIASDGQFRELRLPVREHLVPPIKEEWLRDYLTWSKNPRYAMALDIETIPEARRITCVGFAFSRHESITLPWPEYRTAIKQLCESPCQKILQNGGYDTYWLSHWNIDVRNYVWDTLAMAHCLDCTMPGFDLATLGSLYTRQPFWKRSRKETDTDTVDRTPLDKLYEYNGTDCTVTYEVWEKLRKQLLGLEWEEDIAA